MRRLYKNYSLSVGLLISVFAVAIFSFFVVNNFALGSAPSGLPASQKTATTTQVGPQQIRTLFQSRTSCSSRVIATRSQAINLFFADPAFLGDTSSTTQS